MKSDTDRTTAANAARLATTVGLQLTKRYSFPFPRPVAHGSRHNECVLPARVPERPAQ